MRTLRELCEKNEFHPGLSGLFTNPFYFARLGLLEGIASFAGYVHGRTLDVGCGSKPYERLFKKVTEYIGLDIDQSGHSHEYESIDYYYDGKTFPFGDNEFDSVVTFEVLEHVFNPQRFFTEIYRVLNDDGLVLMTVPFVWDEHEQPYDFARYSSYGLRHLLEQNGFEILELKKTVNDVRVIFQLINDYIYKKTRLFKKGFYSDLTLSVITMAPFNILGALLNLILPSNNDLYLDNIVLAKKADHRTLGIGE